MAQIATFQVSDAPAINLDFSLAQTVLESSIERFKGRLAKICGLPEVLPYKDGWIT